MISSAADRLLTANTGTLPNVSGAMLDWFQPMVFTAVTKTVVNFKVVESANPVDFMGVWQPYSAQQLQMRPEGQRNWKWFTVHSTPDLILDPDQVVTYLGTQYRVKDKFDYTQYGYLEYHLVQDFTGSGP